MDDKVGLLNNKARLSQDLTMVFKKSAYVKAFWVIYRASRGNIRPNIEVTSDLTFVCLSVLI